MDAYQTIVNSRITLLLQRYSNPSPLSNKSCLSSTTATTSSTNGELRSALGRVYLQSGQIHKAETHFAVVAMDASVPGLTKVPNAAFVASARGDWVTASDVLHGLVEEDDANCAMCSIIR